MTQQMLFSTGPTVHGETIESHCGVVYSEVLCTVPVLKEMASRVRDIIGGRLHSYEKVLRSAREQASRDHEQQATVLGAQAIVSMSVEHHWIGRPGSVLMVCMSGTAVVLRSSTRDREKSPEETA